MLFYCSSCCFLIIALSTSCGISLSVLRSVLSICCFCSSSCCILRSMSCFSRSLASRACWDSLLVWSSSSLSWSTWACKGLGWKLEVRKLTFAKEPEEGFVAMTETQQPAAQSRLLVAARSYQSPARHSSSASDSSSVRPATGSVRPDHWFC